MVKYTDKTGKKDQAYYYRIQAVGKNGESALSAKHWCRILKAPVLNTVLPQESGIMKLSWTKANHAGGYMIYRQDGADGRWKKIGTITSASVTTWQDKDTKQEVEYRYQIQAYAVHKKDQTKDYSDCSNVIAAQHLEVPVLQLTETEDHQVQLSWKKTADSDSYRIFRINALTGSKEALNTSAISYQADSDSYIYTDTDVEAGHAYTYSIQAVRGQEDQTAVSDVCTQQISLKVLETE